MKSINFSQEKLKAILLKSGINKSCLLFPYLVNIAIKMLARAIRQIKKNFKKILYFHFMSTGIVLWVLFPLQLQLQTDVIFHVALEN